MCISVFVNLANNFSILFMNVFLSMLPSSYYSSELLIIVAIFLQLVVVIQWNTFFVPKGKCISLDFSVKNDCISNAVAAETSLGAAAGKLLQSVSECVDGLGGFVTVVQQLLLLFFEQDHF